MRRRSSPPWPSPRSPSTSGSPRAQRRSRPRRRAPLSWPFQGTESVATAHEADWKAAFGPATRRWVLGHRARATRWSRSARRTPCSPPTTRPGRSTSWWSWPRLAGAARLRRHRRHLRQRRRHHGFDAVVPFHSYDQEVSGNARSFVRSVLDLVTVVVGGPRAGGLLVNADGIRQNINDLPAVQFSFDSRGITWLYASVSFDVRPPDRRHHHAHGRQREPEQRPLLRPGRRRRIPGLSA